MDIEDKFIPKDEKDKSSKKGKNKPQAARQLKAQRDSLRKKLKANGESECGKNLKRK